MTRCSGCAQLERQLAAAEKARDDWADTAWSLALQFEKIKRPRGGDDVGAIEKMQAEVKAKQAEIGRELAALRKCVRALLPLSPEARDRVLVHLTSESLEEQDAGEVNS